MPATAVPVTPLVVSNTEQTVDTEEVFVGVVDNAANRRTVSNAFRTGSRGATITEVGIRLGPSGVGDGVAASNGFAGFRVRIFGDQSGEPFGEIDYLLPPAQFTPDAINTFTARPNRTLTLRPNTTYHLVIDSNTQGTDATDRIHLSVTSSDDEDAGGQSGWRIANTHDQTESSPVPGSVGELRYEVTNVATSLMFILEGRPSGAAPVPSTLTDKEILVEFYNATGGSGWTEGWNIDQPLGAGLAHDDSSNTDWPGVSTDSEGRVTELSLSENGLRGRIPSSLGFLTGLTHLNLSSNELTGPLPARLGNLGNLTFLALGRNPLNLGPMPTWVYGLTNLTALYMHDAGLTSVSSELAELSGLEVLWLHENELTGPLPSWLGRMTSLDDLDLSHNDFSGPIPQEFRGLTNLRWFYMRGNQLDGGIPAFIGDMTNLRDLFLEDNRFSGAIPGELGGLGSLRNMDLSGNRLNGAIPGELGGLGLLSLLDLSGNRLAGSIPSGLGNLAGNAITIDLSDNELAGSIPPELGGVRAWSLDLSGNRLSGSIPAELGGTRGGTAKILDTLYLNDNRLSGPIPDALFELTALSRLDLSGNRLTGPVSIGFDDMTQLRVLHLHHNDLVGVAPARLFELSLPSDPDPATPLQHLVSLTLDPEQIADDGMIFRMTGRDVYLDLPENPTPAYADADRTYAWLRVINEGNTWIDVADEFKAAVEADVPGGATLPVFSAEIPENSRGFVGVSLEMFDASGSPVAGGRLAAPAVVCLYDGSLGATSTTDRLIGLKEGATSWRQVPKPAEDPMALLSACGSTRDLGIFTTAGKAAVSAARPSAASFTLTVGPDGGGRLALLGEIQVLLNFPAGSVARGDEVEFVVRRASAPSPRGFLVSDDPDVVDITITEGELLLGVTVCMERVQDLKGEQLLLRLGEGSGSAWEALPRAAPPAGYESGWVCGWANDLSFFTVGAAIVRGARISYIEPSIRGVTVSAGDAVV